MTSSISWHLCWCLWLGANLLATGSVDAAEDMRGALLSDSGRFQEGYHSGKTDACDDCGSSGWANAVRDEGSRLSVDWSDDDVVILEDIRSMDSVLVVLRSHQKLMQSSCNRSFRETPDSLFPRIMNLRLRIAPNGSVTQAVILSGGSGKKDLEEWILRFVRRIRFGPANDSSSLDWALHLTVKKP